ncbi:unnamed protein product [Bursaphelenchus okinawaensis]|uniref:RING-type domain-containing protein n=1 Tax=Bursaphelenchus okinawaensis TaxID=465554 RepID=A0A811KIB3_9BILA|nr:unnamed protein product [Bursaphelenchus okinawaensis]CAG9103367.1 unnamed protein product [Bursaphelenchus okinawaensis]
MSSFDSSDALQSTTFSVPITLDHVAINMEENLNEEPIQENNEEQRRGRFSNVVDRVTEAGIPLSDDDAATLVDLLGRFSLNRQNGFLIFLPDYHVLNVMITVLILSFLTMLRSIYFNVYEIIILVMHLLFYRDYVQLTVVPTRPFWKVFMQFFIRFALLMVLVDNTEFFNVISFGVIDTGSLFHVLYTITVANCIVMDVCLLIGSLVNRIEKIDKTIRAQLCKTVEYVFVCYLSVMPVMHWQRFFDSLWLFTPYILLKSIMFTRLTIQTISLIKHQLLSTHIGVAVSAKDIEDDNCAICLNTMTSGVKLPCGHIFEELCVRKWLEERNECPLCRKTVVPNFTKYDRVPMFPPYLL